MVTLENQVDLTEEHASGMSHTNIIAGDSALSRDGNNHDEMSKYLADDSVVFTKEITVRDSGLVLCRTCMGMRLFAECTPQCVNFVF